MAQKPPSVTSRRALDDSWDHSGYSGWNALSAHEPRGMLNWKENDPYPLGDPHLAKFLDKLNKHETNTASSLRSLLFTDRSIWHVQSPHGPVFLNPLNTSEPQDSTKHNIRHRTIYSVQSWQKSLRIRVAQV